MNRLDTSFKWITNNNKKYKVKTCAICMGHMESHLPVAYACLVRMLPIRIGESFFPLNFHKLESTWSLSKVHGVNMGSTWDLSAPDGPHVGPMNFATWEDLCAIIRYHGHGQVITSHCAHTHIHTYIYIYIYIYINHARNPPASNIVYIIKFAHGCVVLCCNYIIN